MQIFNKENGKEVVYVQFEDLYFLETMDKLPYEILIETVFEEVVTVKGEDEEEAYFMKFTSYQTVRFFKSMSVLIDYKKESRKSIEELEKSGEELNQQLRLLRKKMMDVNVDVWQKDEIKERMAMVSYHAQGLEELYLAKVSGERLPLPAILDSDVFLEDFSEYVVRRTIDGQKLFVMRKDGERVDEGVISLDTIEEVVKKDILDKGLDLPESKYIYYSYIGLNEEETALVIEYMIYKPEKRKGNENIFKKLLKKVM